VKVASLDALDAVKAKAHRVCPLICEQGFKADGDRCAKITCRAGYEVGDENTCEKIEAKKPSTERRDRKREQTERAKIEAAPKQQASGQTLCNSQGCRQVRAGCKVTYINTGGVDIAREVCN
jgi:hypothetical protein